jgi:serine/threonine-protein kinase RsbW
MGNSDIPYESDFCLNGDIRELERLVGEVARFCEQHPSLADTEFQLNLVLEELFVNAVRHGGCAGMADAACVRMRYGDGAVHVIFSDRGDPFDLTEAPEADTSAPLADRRGGGLGIHLVRQIMRGVTYRREDGWNVLNMEHAVEQRQETL